MCLLPSTYNHTCCSRHLAVPVAILWCSCYALELAQSHHTLFPPCSYKASGSLASQDPCSRCPEPPRANWWKVNKDKIPLSNYKPPMLCHSTAFTVVPPLTLHLEPWAAAAWYFPLQPLLYTTWKFGHPSAHKCHFNDLMKGETHWKQSKEITSLHYIIGDLNCRHEFMIQFNKTPLSIKDDAQIWVQKEDRR